MQIRRLALASLAVLLVAARAEAQFRPTDPAPGENFHVELAATFWTPTPGIVISSGALTPLGSSGVDFVQEFSIANKRFTEFRGVLKGGKHRLRIGHVPLQYTEAATLTRTVSFGGRNFNVSANASADLKWDLWRFGYEWDFVSKDRGLVGFISELKYNRVTADLRATDVTGTVSSFNQVNAPIPTLGIIGRAYPHKNVSITAEYSGFKLPGFIRNRFIDASTFEANFKDFDLNAIVSVSRYFGVQGGYRSMTADYVIDSDAGNLAMKGPYFGGMVRF